MYSDGRTADYQQGWLSWAVSVTTLTLYVGWIPALLLLWLFVWVPPVAATLALLYSTLLLRPLLHWRGCIDGYILRTWREYFNFSYYMEGATWHHWHDGSIDPAAATYGIRGGVRVCMCGCVTPVRRRALLPPSCSMARWR